MDLDRPCVGGRRRSTNTHVQTYRLAISRCDTTRVRAAVFATEYRGRHNTAIRGITPAFNAFMGLRAGGFHRRGGCSESIANRPLVTNVALALRGKRRLVGMVETGREEDGTVSLPTFIAQASSKLCMVEHTASRRTIWQTCVLTCSTSRDPLRWPPDMVLEISGQCRRASGRHPLQVQHN